MLNLNLGLYLMEFDFHVDFQSQLHTINSELQQSKDMTMLQRRRINEMLTSLLKDLSEISTILGQNTADVMVSYVIIFN